MHCLHPESCPQDKMIIINFLLAHLSFSAASNFLESKVMLEDGIGLKVLAVVVAMSTPLKFAIFILHVVEPVFEKSRFAVDPRYQGDPCIESIPDSLAFIEPLKAPLQPSDILIYSGGQSYERRTSGFGEITSEYLRRFANHHGYNLVFLDELDYDRTLELRKIKFEPSWHKIFAFKSAIERYPNVKYVVWLDDDILVPHNETDMLNHYINMMEEAPEIEILIGDDIDTQVLNAGMFFARASQFTRLVMEEALFQIGFENDGHFTKNLHFEQSCIKALRDRQGPEDKIRVISHRDGLFNFNTFANIPELMAKPTDAFIHCLSMPPEIKLRFIEKHLNLIDQWYQSLPSNCSYPMKLQ